MPAHPGAQAGRPALIPAQGIKRFGRPKAASAGDAIDHGEAAEQRASSATISQYRRSTKSDDWNLGRFAILSWSFNCLVDRLAAQA